MKKRQLLYMTIITSLITTNIAFGESTIIKGNRSIEKFIEEINSLLQVKYTDYRENGDSNSNSNSIYEINADGEKIETAFNLKLKIEEYILKEKVLDIEIIDKGHKEENGEIIGKEYSTYDRYQTNEELYEIYNNYKNQKIINTIQLLDRKNKIATEIEKIEKVVITLLSGQEIEISKGSEKLNFKKCIDKNGNRVNLDNVDINTSEGMSVAKAIVGFERLDELGYLKEFDIPSKVLADIKVIEDGYVASRDLKEFYNGSYSRYGKDFIESLADKVFYYNGSKFNLNYDLLEEGKDEDKIINNVTKIIYKDGKYSFDIKMNVAKDISLYLINNQNFKLNIYSESHTKIESFRRDVINAMVNGSKDINNQEYDILAGEDRFETSVEISKEYTKINNANGVVLVGKDAITDGLSAAPFAKYKNSPILLTNKDNIPSVIMEEIKRIFNNYSGVDTIYIIGGEDTISDNVYNQLVSELKKVRIKRIYGEDRYETSVNICSYMDLSSVNNAYIVGGYGEADAMSVAPLAVRQGAPIIVSPKNGLTKDEKYLFESNDSIVDVNVIGGRVNVDTQVMLDVKKCGYNRENNTEINVSRISGDDRQETNAMILDLFNFKNEENIIIAKDGMENSTHLVDSLSASILGSPIVLGKDNIKQEQVNSIRDIISETGCKLTQVGNGIKYEIIRKIIDQF